jgi:cytochrome c oxidase assembly factor CtaG
MRPIANRTAALVAACVVAVPAWAHGDHAAEPAPGWTWDAWIVIPLTITALVFAIGVSRLRPRARHAGLARRSAWFAAGWLVLTGALVSPLHAAGERSFSAHMLEHEMLMLVAAPLIVLARPMPILLWGLPAAGRRALGKIVLAAPVAVAWSLLVKPVAATLLQAAALLLWHTPALFDLALAHEGWHAAQHFSFLVSALIFWTAMLGGRSRRSERPVAALCLFATSVVSGALGALMAFSESPWYVGYARLGMAPYGLSLAEDQQLAGLIMWVPGGAVHAVAALLLVSTLFTPAHPDEAANAA